MSRTIGKRASVGIGKETTPGTEVTPTYWLPVNEKSPGIVAEYVPDDSDYGVIHDTISSEVVYRKGEPSFDGIMYDQSFGLILLAALGSVSTSANTPETGVHTHTFSVLNSEVHPALTVAFKDANQDYCFPYAKLGELTLNLEKKALCRYEVSFVAQKKTTDSNTVAYATDENHWNSSMASFKLANTQAGLAAASVIPVENINLKISKELIEQDSLGSDEPVNIYNGVMTVEVDVEVLMDNTTYQSLFENGTVQAVQIKLLNSGVTIGLVSNPTLTIELNAVNFEALDFSYARNEIVRQTLTGKAHYKLTDSKAISAVLVNTEASY